VEYETPVEEAIERRRGRPTNPSLKAPESQLSASEQAAIRPGLTASPALRPSAVQGLQRTAGNAAVTALIQRRPAATEQEDEPLAVRDVIGRGGGQPLDPTLKDEMEAQFGQDFSAVRIHAGDTAARSAAELSARAYTAGNEIVLGNESPALESAAGKHVLAHELTHVIQQRQGPVSGTPVGGGISISDPSDVFEQAAEHNAAQLMSAASAPPERTGPTEALESALTGMSLQRQEEEEEEEEAAETPSEQAPAETTAAYQPEAGAEGGEEAVEEAGEAEQEIELAEAGKAEAVEEAAEDEGAELEIEEDEVAQAQAQITSAEEEEEEEVAV
jgi:hypothetical protein